jgi:hypothetical protein
MNTFQIAASVLADYKTEKLTDERINSLIIQVNEQLDEISQNQETYNRLLSQSQAPKKVDNIILWIYLMSNEDICCQYINKFNKDFTEMIPVADLADLLFHSVYLKKVQNIELDGFKDLMEYKSEGIQDMDQYAFTNVFLYIQKLKTVDMEF